MSGTGRVLVIGDIVTDILAVHSGPIAVGSDTPSNISVSGGGSAANTAAWLAWHGIAVALAGVIGTDHAGNLRLAELAAAGVDCTGVRRSPDAPTGSVIVLAQATERSFLNDRGANLLLSPSDVDNAMAGPVAHVHVSGYTLLDEASRSAGVRALATTRSKGIGSSVDAASAAPLRRVTAGAFRDWIHGADVLFANLEEARVLAGDQPSDPEELARELADPGRGAASSVVVKLGAGGAVWADHTGATIRIPAYPAEKVVDPTGAGDAFAAGFLALWHNGAGPAESMRAGALAGARAVTEPGGRPTVNPLRHND